MQPDVFNHFLLLYTSIFTCHAKESSVYQKNGGEDCQNQTIALRTPPHAMNSLGPIKRVLVFNINRSEDCPGSPIAENSIEG